MGRFVVLIGLLALFMDPCDKKHCEIELSEVREACRSDVGRMFVRVRGRMQVVPQILCKDHPGGRRCESVISSASGKEVLPVLFRGSIKSDAKAQFVSTLVAPKDVSNSTAEPYSVDFDRAELYDRSGKIVDHAGGDIRLSGSLQLDENGGGCKLLAMHVENN